MSQEQLSKLPNPSTAAVLETVIGKWGAYIMNIGLLISVLTSWLAWTMVTAQIPQAAASNGTFPKEFAKEIVFACRDMKNNKKESVLINQLLRSATSIGANIHEAQYAQGTKDFISKLEIAQKECYETEYWLELLFETDCLSEENYKKLHNDCGAIRRMLISSLKTIKANHS